MRYNASMGETAELLRKADLALSLPRLGGTFGLRTYLEVQEMNGTLPFGPSIKRA